MKIKIMEAVPITLGVSMMLFPAPREVVVAAGAMIAIRSIMDVLDDLSKPERPQNDR